MKQCEYKQYADGDYGWAGNATQSCVLAVATGQDVGGMDLYQMRGKVITDAEFNAIRNFDFHTGAFDDLVVLMELGKKLDVEMVLTK